METIFRAWKEIPITENYIKHLHRDLLCHSNKDERHRGEYKTLRNDVGAFDADGKMIGVVFEAANPSDTAYRMTQLVQLLYDAREHKRTHPRLIVAVFVVTPWEIHPFQDGKGRLSRALSTMPLLQVGFDVPSSFLESAIENSKEGYYLALQSQMCRLAGKVEHEKLR